MRLLFVLQKIQALKFTFNNMGKSNRGGPRKGSGAKPKYPKPTTTIAFRVPVSKVGEVKKMVKRLLATYKQTA